MHNGTMGEVYGDRKDQQTHEHLHFLIVYRVDLHSGMPSALEARLYNLFNAVLFAPIVN